jgi:hypothetical protein
MAVSRERLDESVEHGREEQRERHADEQAAPISAPQKKMSPRMSIVGSPTVMTFSACGRESTTA